MKTKSYLIGLLLLAAGLFAFNNHNAGAQNKNSTPAACIILGFTTRMGDIAYHETGWYRPILGMQVTWIDRGPNAANIPIVEGEPLGQAIEKILNNSFRKDKYEWLPTGNGWLVFVR